MFIYIVILDCELWIRNRITIFPIDWIWIGDPHYICHPDPVYLKNHDSVPEDQQITIDNPNPDIFFENFSKRKKSENEQHDLKQCTLDKFKMFQTFFQK